MDQIPYLALGMAEHKIRGRKIVQEGRRSYPGCVPCAEAGYGCWIADGYSKCAYCTSKGNGGRKCRTSTGELVAPGGKPTPSKITAVVSKPQIPPSEGSGRKRGRAAVEDAKGQRPVKRSRGASFKLETPEATSPSDNGQVNSPVKDDMALAVAPAAPSGDSMTHAVAPPAASGGSMTHIQNLAILQDLAILRKKVADAQAHLQEVTDLLESMLASTTAAGGVNA